MTLCRCSENADCDNLNKEPIISASSYFDSFTVINLENNIKQQSEAIQKK